MSRADCCVGITGTRAAQVRERVDYFTQQTDCAVELSFTDQHQGRPFVREDLPIFHAHRTSTGGKDWQCLINHVPALIDDSLQNIKGARDIGVRCYLVGDSGYADFEEAACALISDAVLWRKHFLDFVLKEPTEASNHEKHAHIRKQHTKIECYNCGLWGHKASDCPQPRQPRRR